MSSQPALPSETVDLQQQGISAFARRVGFKALCAVIEWLAHCFVVTVILLGMKALEILSRSLWPGERLFFGKPVPVPELFATVDFVLLGVILVLGVSCVVKAYRTS